MGVPPSPLRAHSYHTASYPSEYSLRNIWLPAVCLTKATLLFASGQLALIPEKLQLQLAQCYFSWIKSPTKSKSAKFAVGRPLARTLAWGLTAQPPASYSMTDVNYQGLQNSWIIPWQSAGTVLRSYTMPERTTRGRFSTFCYFRNIYTFFCYYDILFCARSIL